MPAKVVYQRTWTAVRSSFGAAGLPAPRVLFIDRPGLEMRVTATEQGYRRVEILDAFRSALAGTGSCKEALLARESLIHEFAHVFQAEPWLSGEVRRNVTLEEVPEGLAEAKAQAVMAEVFGVGPEVYEMPVWATYDAYARQITTQYPPSMIDHDQFGANWGRDPRFIPWNEPNPVTG